MVRLFYIVIALLVIGACTHGGDKVSSEVEMQPNAPREMRHALVPVPLPPLVRPPAPRP